MNQKDMRSVLGYVAEHRELLVLLLKMLIDCGAQTRKRRQSADNGPSAAHDGPSAANNGASASPGGKPSQGFGTASAHAVASADGKNVKSDGKNVKSDGKSAKSANKNVQSDGCMAAVAAKAVRKGQKGGASCD